MSGPSPRPPAAAETRLVLFEVAGAAYAIPIAEVLEVMESAPTAGIPGLPRRLAGVVNHHGDALPLVSREALFDVAGAAPGPSQHVLVLAERDGESGMLGVPVDRVVGLADAALSPHQEPGLVVERLPVRGRVTSVLDARRLLGRAATLIDVSTMPAHAR
ncbi:MAG: chemotaxis protein CheW [Deltaproteobacteria bacterium]|nr:chemotaxis protein CheW [Deltaproteobacteria bacterium]